MNEHPHDALPAFALGALDATEASEVLGHVAACPACREDIEAWSEVVALLPYAAAQHAPASDVKVRLLAMVAASGTASANAPARRGRATAFTRLLGAATAGSLALALVFGLLFASARQHSNELSIQLARRDLAMQQMTVQLQQAHKGFDFIAYSAAVDQRLAGPQQAEGKMFMRPGDKEALLVVHGLKPSAPGKTYQFWFAIDDTQVPASVFTVNSEGFAVVLLEAPQAVNTYAQVMVTVEPVGGSERPSDDVVLQAELPT